MARHRNYNRNRPDCKMSPHRLRKTAYFLGPLLYSWFFLCVRETKQRCLLPLSEHFYIILSNEKNIRSHGGTRRKTHRDHNLIALCFYFTISLVFCYKFEWIFPVCFHLIYFRTESSLLKFYSIRFWNNVVLFMFLVNFFPSGTTFFSKNINKETRQAVHCMYIVYFKRPLYTVASRSPSWA